MARPPRTYESVTARLPAPPAQDFHKRMSAAIAQRDLPAVEALHHAEPDAARRNDYLRHALLTGDLKLIRFTFAFRTANATAQARADTANRALYTACLNGNRDPELLRYLLAAGADGAKIREQAVVTGNLPWLRHIYKNAPPENWHRQALFRLAARHGQLRPLIFLYGQGGINRPTLDDALLTAAENGALPLVRWLHRKGGRATQDLRFVAKAGHLDILRYLHEEKAGDIHADDECALQLALMHQKMDVVRWLHGQGANLHRAASGAQQFLDTHMPVRALDYLEKNGVRLTQRGQKILENYRHWAAHHDDFPVELIAYDPQYYDPSLHREIISHAQYTPALLHGLTRLFGTAEQFRAYREKWQDVPHNLARAALHQTLPPAWREALMQCGPVIDKLHYLLPEPCKDDKGRYSLIASAKALSADPKALHSFQCRITTESYRTLYELHEGGVALRERDQDLVASYPLWKKRHGDCPPYLIAENPHLFRPACFADLLGFMAHEGYKEEVAHRYAFHAAGLFGTTERVLTYLEKWGVAGKQPLHDAIQHIQLPQQGRFNIAAWGDAVLRHGPKMAQLVKFAHNIPEPAKDPNGQWSYQATLARVARDAYSRAAENPELSALCFRARYNDSQFSRTLDLVEQYRATHNGPKPEGRIPAITIDGAIFDKPDYHFYKLPDGDPRGLLLGTFTDCCQHIGGAGHACATHGFLSPLGGFYVVADKKKDNIVAQSWAWRGNKRELVLDSLESLGDHMDAPRWTKLCDAFAAAACDDKKAAITAVHIGTGGETPALPYEKAQAATPADYDGYRDSKAQFIVRR